ncbi:beta-N-acetylhexosaminidase [Sediminibacterium sp.]|uniref:beta-N-acetylhexosaminidase n=1 Tax=Sediminibacterium sp. TaxID=1917865 RepID=UPI00273615DF|nr:beta-N-acetylhexosaminidase [Sediminibacterium sp.]MDP3393899.1 beta-N-acetylhexosaminidase [Sediminibacterium sp.]MDP3568770.1 beta-N-acetylhexosaminidase [Sediminibacterium sp.]
MKRLFITAIILCICLFGMAQNANSIIPKPAFISYPHSQDPFVLDSKQLIFYEATYELQAQYLQENIAKQTGIVLSLKKRIDPYKESAAGIYLVPIKPFNQPAEKYELNVIRQNIAIQYQDLRGLINGIQSLLQLMPIGQFNAVKISPIHIEDYPRFAYRGMHLDVVRHIFPVNYIKKYIDYLAFHKFNTFHWHLTDDQGWRIEMDAYPKLNTIGSYRNETLIGHFKDSPAQYDGTRYGGFYTKAEIKEIVQYAAIRAITVIPEIDIPGHSRAAIAAYPELSTKPDTIWNVATTWGMYNRQNNVLAPKPATFKFLEKVFDEVVALFPSPYIHVGGDECSKIWWKQDPATQVFMKQKGLKNETALQTYFIEFIANHLKSKGKQTIGWHEINEGDLDTSTIVMNWGTEKQAIEAASKGFNVINTPGKPFYFDHYQSLDPKDSLAIHGYNPLEAVYNYNPIPATIIQKGLSNKIIGGQANVWTEYMGNEKKVDYMIFPRMTALSETLWSIPEKKNYIDFLKRIEQTAIPRYLFWNSSWFKDYAKWDLSKLPK